MSGYVGLVLLWVWVFGFLGTLIYLHKKKYFPKDSGEKILTHGHFLWGIRNQRLIMNF